MHHSSCTINIKFSKKILIVKHIASRIIVRIQFFRATIETNTILLRSRWKLLYIGDITRESHLTGRDSSRCQAQSALDPPFSFSKRDVYRRCTDFSPFQRSVKCSREERQTEKWRKQREGEFRRRGWWGMRWVRGFGWGGGRRVASLGRA